VRLLAVNWLDRENPQAGGAEVHFFEIFKRLAAAGDEVTLITSGFAGASSRSVIDGIAVRRYGGRHSFAGMGRRAVRTTLSEQPYDVVIEDINKLPLYLPNLTDLPFVAVVPHLFGGTVFREASWPVAALIWAAERPIPWVYRHAAFHAISRSTKDDLVSRGVPAEKIRVIYPGVDAARFCPDPAVSRASNPTFLYVGRLKRYKGVDVAIRALATLLMEMPSVRLQVAGSGGDRARLERLAARLGVRHAVEFLGFVSEEEKIQLLRRAWALVFPSAKEGWGMTNVEAAACGTPAIAANSPGLRESVVDGQTGILVDVGDVAGFARAMRQCATSDGFGERMRADARSFAERFTWDEAAKQTREHIVETVATKA